MRPIVIISAMFYPQPNVGAVRVTEWAKHLPEFGWKPIVVCPNHGPTATRGMLDSKVHPEAEVYYLNPKPQRRKTDLAAGPLGKIKQTIYRSKYWVPDPALLLWRRHRGSIEKIMRVQKPAAFITSAPPHSIHGIGPFLRKKTGALWIADFRDPWLIDARFQPSGMSRLLWFAHKVAEARVYENADLITHAIPIHYRWARHHYAFAKERMMQIMNGAPDELADGSVIPIRTERGNKSIRVVGNPGDDVQTAQLARTVQSVDNLELWFIGRRPENEPELYDILGDRLRIVGRVPHDEALQYIAGGDLLVAILSAERRKSLLLSSKIFEYAATDAGILVINPTRSDRLLLKKIENAQSINDPSDEALLRIASDQLTSSSISRQINRRREQVKRLAKRLDDIVG